MFTGAVLQRGRAPCKHSRCRGTERRPDGGRGNLALLAPVGAQLLYLAVHLVYGLADPGLQPSPQVVGEIPREALRFLEEHARVLARSCSSDSWDSAICRSAPRSHPSVIESFYLDLSVPELPFYGVLGSSLGCAGRV